MALYNLGSDFTASTPEGPQYIAMYYDSGIDLAYTQRSGPGADYFLETVTEAERGNPEGVIIFNICEGTKKIVAKTSFTNPFVTMEVTPDSPDCAYVPPVDSCDLVVNSIEVTNEQSTDADDGTATINASSSHAPIEYSLDNVNFQSSNVFTNLAPGNYVAYLKDALSGCNKSSPFSIAAYNIPVQNFTNDLPVVNLGSGNLSRWNAAFNPINHTYQRKDFTVESVTQQNANQVIVTLPYTLNATQVQQALSGRSYVKTPLYEIYETAVSHSIVSAKSRLVFNRLYIGDDTGGFLNLLLSKQGYVIQTEITFGDNAYDQKVLIAEHSPEYTGKTTADLSKFLQSQIAPKETWDYTTSSFKDANLGQSYKVRFREVWQDNVSEWFDAPYPLYFTYTARQLGEPYNGNMADYVTFPTVQKAKFLTDFKEPVFFQGHPFEIDFILSENVLDKELFLELIPNCGTTTPDFLINGDGAYILDGDMGRFIISSVYDAGISGYPIPPQLGINRLLIPDEFDCCATKIVANIYYMDGGDKVYIMEPLTIRTNCVCDDPEVYIKWVNSRGGWDYYRFGYNQDKQANVTIDTAISRFVNDWTNDDTIQDNVSKSSIPSIFVGADLLPEDDANALQWAKKSIKAQILVSSNPVKWQTVIIKDGLTDVMKTRKPYTNSVRFELVLRSDNLQSQ